MNNYKANILVANTKVKENIARHPRRPLYLGKLVDSDSYPSLWRNHIPNFIVI